MSLKSTAVLGSDNKYVYMETNNSQLVIYQTPQGDTCIDVRVNGDTIWLTRRQIAEPFGTKVPAISRHLKNIYASGELHEYMVISKMETTTRHGAIAGKTQTYRGMRQNLNFDTTSCIKKINMKKFLSKSGFYCILSVLFFISLSCGCRKKEQFTVYYIHPTVEFCASPTCEDIENECNREKYNDTVYIDSDVAEQIRNGIINAKPINNPSIIPDIYIYVKIADLNLYLDHSRNVCWIKKGNNKPYIAVVSDRTAYLIKWKSGYYNHECYEGLKISIKNRYDSGLARYGIPSDYKYDEGIVEYATYFDGRDSVLMKIPSDQCTSKVLVWVK